MDFNLAYLKQNHQDSDKQCNMLFVNCIIQSSMQANLVLQQLEE